MKQRLDDAAGALKHDRAQLVVLILGAAKRIVERIVFAVRAPKVWGLFRALLERNRKPVERGYREHNAAHDLGDTSRGAPFCVAAPPFRNAKVDFAKRSANEASNHPDDEKCGQLVQTKLGYVVRTPKRNKAAV